jgi:hypothetical protein
VILKTPLPLALDNVDVRPPMRGGRSVKPWRLDFDQKQNEKIEIQGDFYRVGLGGAKLEAELLLKLKLWMDKQGWTKKQERTPTQKDVPYFLKLMDIEEKSFRDLPSDHDRHNFVLRRFKTLMSQFHPDRFDEDPAGKETATQFAKELLEARDVLSAAYPG